MKRYRRDRRSRTDQTDSGAYNFAKRCDPSEGAAAQRSALLVSKGTNADRGIASSLEVC